MGRSLQDRSKRIYSELTKDAKGTASKAVGNEMGFGHLVGSSIRRNRSQWLKVGGAAERRVDAMYRAAECASGFTGAQSGLEGPRRCKVGSV
jgi:hypothetical protein